MAAAKKKSAVKIHSLGRRKSSVARLTMTSGKGNIVVNGKKLAEYFGETTVYPAIAMRPMKVLDTKEFDVSVRVHGGGVNGQADAISLALARALCAHEKSLIQIAAGKDEDSEEGSEGQGANDNLKWRSELKSLKLLTRNPRCVERKKFGFRKARKKEQYSKR